jgi:hypothetical protein
VRLRLGYLLAWAVATAIVAGATWFGAHSVLSEPVQTRTAIDVGRVNRGPAPRVVQPGGSPAPGWTSVPNGRGATAYRRVFRTNGGEVSAWCEPGEARVLSTTPKTGYTVNIKRSGPDWVEVTFSRERQASRVLLRWWDAPYAEVAESVS